MLECPICDGPVSLVAEIEEEQISGLKVLTRTYLCDFNDLHLSVEMVV